ncbi:transporter, partial [bacterium]
MSGHGGGGSNFYNPFSTSSRPPRTFLSFTFNVDALDDGLGEVLRYQLAGEYAVHRRFSVGMRLPFLTIREKFLPRSDGIGDIALSFKGLLWSQPSSRMNLTLGGGFSFPTGNEAKGLGAGDVLVGRLQAALKAADGTVVGLLMVRLRLQSGALTLGRDQRDALVDAAMDRIRAVVRELDVIVRTELHAFAVILP